MPAARHYAMPGSEFIKFWRVIKVDSILSNLFLLVWSRDKIDFYYQLKIQNTEEEIVRREERGVKRQYPSVRIE